MKKMHHIVPARKLKYTDYGFCVAKGKRGSKAGREVSASSVTM